MTIVEIKSCLGVVSLDFKRSLDKDKNVTEWYRAWDNDTRVAIFVHEDLKDTIKTNDRLSLKSKGETVSEAGEKYKTYVIVEFEGVEFSV